VAIIRQVRAYEGETVQIRWTFEDGTILEDAHQAPIPREKAARQAEHVTVGPMSDAEARKRARALQLGKDARADVVDLTGQAPLPPGDPKRGGTLL
jgi:hypothetical protein